MPNWLVSVILGTVEGLTEFIPVSSTGHLLLAEQWLPRQSDLFNLVIQCAAVLAVIPLFSARLRSLLSATHDREAREYLLKLIAAFGITAVGGLVLEKRNYKLPEAALPVAVALLLGGVLFLLFERWLSGRTLKDDISWSAAIAMGVGQLVAAVFPGSSRSGATILLALACASSRRAATEFSFVLGVPTILAVGVLKLGKAFRAGAPAEDWTAIAIASAVALAVSFVAVKWFLGYVRSHTFNAFGWYRIGLGLTMLLLLQLGLAH
jgi:undecaprenyl-diphosphatase